MDNDPCWFHQSARDECVRLCRGRKDWIDVGGNFELSTVTAVGKASTQTTLSATAIKSEANIKVAADPNMTVGDTLTIGTGERKELVTITSVGTPGATGTRINLAAPLRFDHAVGIDVSDAGKGDPLFAGDTISSHQRRRGTGAGQRHHTG
jgi:hypothetical protein